MQVYVVVGALDCYESASFETMRVFGSKAEAEAYGKALEANGYEWVEIQGHRVEAELAVA